MNIPPLCIIQARYHSTRLPGKMLLPLRGRTLIERAVIAASDAFGRAHVVVAIPAEQPVEFREHLDQIGATVLQSPANESDVLLRFFHAAHAYRWHPDSVIVRWTPDDPFKDRVSLHRVANGERLPVEMGGEAFTLAMLDDAQVRVPREAAFLREHITYALFPSPAPAAPPAAHEWTIDTREQYESVKAYVEAI